MRNWKRITGCRRSFACLAGSLFLATITFGGQSDAKNDSTKPLGLAPIREYIFKSWDTLTRSMEDCSTVVDSKLAENSVLYLPADFATPSNVEELQKRCHVQVKNLPKKNHRPRPNRHNGTLSSGPPLSGTQICRSRRALQRNVRLGQLLHRSRPAAGR